MYNMCHIGSRCMISAPIMLLLTHLFIYYQPITSIVTISTAVGYTQDTVMIIPG